ncbi:transcriptional corepressor cyc8 [Tubulinosema ratisbonensis]|uniref:Transcriptional corepressor cyc8 n=1 Tax=Tubulinosema ratisbonensis TaxID=291195 RepID=A0A437AP48_9MICR|nr:transcriptional corepressor cyc8 [Tubulinosema ratisbonensis]
MNPQNPSEHIEPYYNNEIYLLDAFESLWCDLGNICSNFGLTKMTIFCFDNALRNKKTGHRNLYRIAREFLFIESYEKITEIIGKLNDMNAPKFYNEVLSGHLFLHKNKLKESFSSFSKALHIGNIDFLLYYGIARWNEATKKYQEAVKYYSIVLKKYPSHIIAHKSRYRIMTILKMTNALSYAKRFLLTMEKDEFCFIEKEAFTIQFASCYELENEDEPAIKLCENIISTKPNYIFAYRLISYIYFKLKNYQSAIEHLDRGLSIFNADRYLYYLKGKILFLQNNYDRSSILLSKAVEYSSNDPYIWNSYGIVCYKLKNYEQAEICFKNSISFDKNFLEPKFNLMLVFRLFNRINETKKILDELCMNNRSDIELISMCKNIGVDSVFYETECRDCDFNVGTSMYFSADSFLGGNSFYVDAGEYSNLELDPETEIKNEY